MPAGGRSNGSPPMFTLCWCRNAGGRGKKRPRKPDILDLYPSLPVLLNHWEEPTLQIGVDSSFHWLVQNCKVPWIQSQLRALTDNQLWYKFGNYDLQYHRGVTDNHKFFPLPAIYMFFDHLNHPLSTPYGVWPIWTFGRQVGTIAFLHRFNPWLWKNLTLAEGVCPRTSDHIDRGRLNEGLGSRSFQRSVHEYGYMVIGVAEAMNNATPRSIFSSGCHFIRRNLPHVTSELGSHI